MWYAKYFFTPDAVILILVIKREQRKLLGRKLWGAKQMWSRRQLDGKKLNDGVILRNFPMWPIKVTQG